MRLSSILIFAMVLAMVAPVHTGSKPNDSNGNPLASALWVESDQIDLNLPGKMMLEDSDQFFLVTSLDGSSSVSLQTSNVLKRPVSLKTSITLTQAKSILQGPLWLEVRRFEKGQKTARLIFRTHVQAFPLIDKYFSEQRLSLGLTWQKNIPVIRVWSPLAEKISIRVFSTANGSDFVDHEMQKESNTWALQGTADWEGKYYQFVVTRFSPWTDQMETVLTTDPYSVALSADSKRSLFFNFDSLPKNKKLSRLKAKVDPRNAVIYEAHVRDLTASDQGIPSEQRGKFLGLANKNSLARKHLQDLAQSGITHLHLMPLFDFGSIPEVTSEQKTWDNINPSPESKRPQEQIGLIRSRDNYNWGYDPLHFFSPEGSYASNPDGESRVVELMNLISDLREIGLGLVMDVVFNHTYDKRVVSSGQTDTPFDALVPLYYHRRDQWGEIMNSSCCADFATEKVMSQRLITDALKFWATNYQVSGFRFDLMNLFSKSDVQKIKMTVRSWTQANDGIDGNSILLYGEAWPFGSLETLHPGTAFFNNRSFGVGVGVFNDRLRDALRGGTTNSLEKSDQGFATGLYWDFNQEPANTNTPVAPDDQRQKLLHLGDVVKVGLLGNLRDVRFRDHLNSWVSGGQLIYRGSPTGLAESPEETINYASAHDGYSLFDSVQAKLPFNTPGRVPSTATSLERAQTQLLMLATVALSQGIPFFESGSELLRSKSGDQDSYDSGDWFNQIDFSLTENGWGKGLPVSWKNQSDWTFWLPRLQSNELKVSPELISLTNEAFKAFLEIRRDNPLFHLPTAEAIQNQVRFPMDDDTESDIPGVVVYQINSSPKRNFKSLEDVKTKRVIVFFNASNQIVDFTIKSTRGKKISLHDRLKKLAVAEFDLYHSAQIKPAFEFGNFLASEGKFILPPRSVSVWEEFP